MRRRGGVSRRVFAAQAGALGAALAFGRGCAHAPPVARSERRDLYAQGVASGDPGPDSVILWTRRAPEPGVEARRLWVEVADDPVFARVVARGEVDVTAQTDWTCRFLAAGLRPAREYWYRFIDDAGAMSRVGRTLTAPAESDDRAVRFAFVSCQDVTQGACNAYKRMIHEDLRRPREEQLSFVLHLGDFFYEVVWYPEDSPDGRQRGRRLRDIVRYPNGEKMRNFHLPTDLEDYRTAYRGYLRDPDLQDARARWPFVAVWDNHEFSWRGYQSQQFFDNAPRPAQTMKVAASQAWYEYQPARVAKPGRGDPFEAPLVANAPLTDFDARGLGVEYNNAHPSGAMQCALNMTVLHGVRASLALEETGDAARARAARNPDVSPHLAFADFGGHGYATVRASADELETEFVCIPRPFERSDAEDGGPMLYRARHRVRLWGAGERPELRQEIVEGDAALAV